jgi:tRNA/tmRNA/rRNA uracil-C5-methylase (TrmA/RlmC/RlmD family)
MSLDNRVKLNSNNITMNIIEQMDSNTNTSKMSKLELLEKCKELGFTKCNSKNKSQLIEMIQQNNLNEEKIPSVELEFTPNTLNVIDLFCGCGGMSKGLTDAGLNVIVGIDIWDKAVQSYNKNFSHKAY